MVTVESGDTPLVKGFHRKTLLLSESFPPSVGGIQNSLAQLWDTLPPETTVVIAPKRAEGTAVHEWDASKPYRIVRVGMNSFTYPRWRHAQRALYDIASEHKPEVVVCGKALFEGRAALALKRRTGIPYVVLTYGLEIGTWMNSYKAKRDFIQVIRNASRVVCINNEIKSIIQKVGVPEERIVKMYPGISKKYLREVPEGEKDRVQKKYGLSKNPYFCTMCRLVSRKGVDTVIRAFPEVRKIIPNTQYVIIGDGPERGRLEQLVQESNCSDNVRFLGSIPDEDVFPVFSGGSLFVMTPRKEGADMEGFGIVYMEAAAFGLPSVASRTGGVPEAVQDGTTGIIVPPDDPDATANAIIRLLTHSEERIRLGKNAKLRAWNDFHPKRRALLFHAILESAVLESKKESQ